MSKAFVGLVVLAMIAMAIAAEGSEFGTCSDWVKRKKGIPDDLYRVGLAHGFAFGVGANLFAYYRGPNTVNDPPVDGLHGYFTAGWAQMMLRPAILVDAFDMKCLDYRNTGIRLTDVGLLVMLELGGIKSDRIDELCVSCTPIRA